MVHRTAAARAACAVRHLNDLLCFSAEPRPLLAPLPRRDAQLSDQSMMYCLLHLHLVLQKRQSGPGPCGAGRRHACIAWLPRARPTASVATAEAEARAVGCSRGRSSSASWSTPATASSAASRRTRAATRRQALPPSSTPPASSPARRSPSTTSPPSAPPPAAISLPQRGVAPGCLFMKAVLRPAARSISPHLKCPDWSSRPLGGSRPRVPLQHAACAAVIRRDVDRHPSCPACDRCWPAPSARARQPGRAPPRPYGVRAGQPGAVLSQRGAAHAAMLVRAARDRAG